jgi:hypothetical protein
MTALAITETESVFERVLRLCEVRAEQTFQWTRKHFDSPHVGRSPVEVGAFLELNTGLQIDQISSEDHDNRFDYDKCFEVKAYARKIRRNPGYDYYTASLEDGEYISEKMCSRCHNVYPATQAYFYLDNRRKDQPLGKFRTFCKWCDNTTRQQRRD